MISLQGKYKLSNGIEIPEVGFGTWQTPDGDTAVNAVKWALEYGYRHIDTAAGYGNEKSVGRAIRESGIPREEIFITSKLKNTDRGYENTIKAFQHTLSELEFDYIDLYLIHWPATLHQFTDWQQINQDTWRAIEELYEDGKIKAIGLSNFLPHHINSVLETAKVKPMVNQIEFHPGFTQADTVKFSQEQGMLVEAWSPLGTGKMLQNPQLNEIAKRYEVSVAQLCIKWCLQSGVLPLPKSVTQERIRENLDLEGFSIADEDMRIINNLPYIGGSGLNPDEVDF